MSKPIIFVRPAECSLEAYAQLVKIGRATQFCDPDVEIMFHRLSFRVDRDLIGTMPNLRCVVSPTTGLDHIDLDALNERGIHLISLKGETAFLETLTATAEHTFALLLAVCRRLPEAMNNWQHAGYRGMQLKGKRMGIVGYGRVGLQVEAFAWAFQMFTRLHDAKWKDTHILDCVSGCDILCICAALTPDNQKMINRDVFNALPAGAILINTARGQLIDEDAMLEALESGKLAGAGLDVLSNEHDIPTKGHKVLEYAKTHPNVIVTPHIAGQTYESVRDADLFVIQKLKEWLSG